MKRTTDVDWIFIDDKIYEKYKELYKLFDNCIKKAE